MKVLETSADAQAMTTILKRMAFALDPVLARDKTVKPFSSSKRVCHQLVVNTIKGRKNLSDTIWLYGDGHIVYHSCLSNGNTCLIGGSYSKGSDDRWMGSAGFDTEMGVLEMMYSGTVKQWIAVHFTESPL